MSQFDQAVSFVLENEGGLSDNPRDKGSITNFGISLRFLKNIPPDNLKKYGIYSDDEEAIRTLSLEQVRAIYMGEFWIHAPFEKIANQEHCNYIFDMAVSLGISPAIKCVQRACWAVMKRWQILVDDGIMGQKTLLAIKQCGIFIMPALRAERGNYYRNIVNIHPDQKEFLKGWYDRTYDA